MLEQIVNDRMKFDVKSEFRAIYSTYGGSFSWAPAYTEPLGLHFSVFAEHLISHNQTPNSNSYGLEIGFLSDTPTAPHYALASSSDLEALESWVKTPAVYMERVLAIAEEQTTLNAPMITSMEPDIGPLVGGNTVIIHGTNFLPGVTVTFNGVSGIVTIISSTELSVIVPALTLGELEDGYGAGDVITEEVDVVVTNGDGQETVFTGGYTYTSAFEPELTGVSPTSGPPAGDQTVTLTGTQLTGTTSVTFDGEEATDVTVVDDETVTVKTPTHSAGVVSIELSTSGGDSTLTDAYTYVSTTTQVDLSSYFNRQGIFTDGSTFSQTEGLTGTGVAYSADLLGTSQTYNGTAMSIGTANTSNVIKGTGQTITLPSGNFSTLNMLATAVNGNQTSQSFTVTYTDNSTTTFTQSLSRFAVSSGFSGETVVVTMAYANVYNGTFRSGTFSLYGYNFSLDSSKTVKSITLPNNSNVNVLSLTLKA